MSKEGQSASEYMDSLNHDIFEKTIYVFTPKGKVIELPVGSTPVDFAYRIHTKIGDTCTGALVNGVMSPLYTILKTGDMVEVKTNKAQAGPPDGWLDFVKTNTAKMQIKKYIAKKNEALLRDDMILKGKSSLIDAFQERDIDEKGMLEYLNNPKLFQYFGLEDLDDLYLHIYQRS